MFDTHQSTTLTQLQPNQITTRWTAYSIYHHDQQKERAAATSSPSITRRKYPQQYPYSVLKRHLHLFLTTINQIPSFQGKYEFLNEQVITLILFQSCIKTLIPILSMLKWILLWNNDRKE